MIGDYSKLAIRTILRKKKRKKKEEEEANDYILSMFIKSKNSLFLFKRNIY